MGGCRARGPDPQDRVAELQQALTASQEAAARSQARVEVLTADHDALADQLAALRAATPRSGRGEGSARGGAKHHRRARTERGDRAPPVGCGAGDGARAAAGSVTELVTERAQLNVQIVALQADNEALEGRVEEAADALAAAERARGTLEQQLDRAESEIETLEDRNADLREALEASQEVRARAQAGVEALSAEQEALAGELAALRADNEALRTEAAENRDQLEAARTAVAQLTTTRERLRGSVAGLEIERARSSAQIGLLEASGTS